MDDETTATSRSRGSSMIFSVDIAARAQSTDFNHFIDTSDWEGVILAAAQPEGNKRHKESSLPSAVMSDSSSESYQSSNAAAAEKGHVVVVDPTILATTTTNSIIPLASWNSKKKIVEELVQRVVPEERQHVDEMMCQFRGREDELIDTLRTMQELDLPAIVENSR